MQETKEKELTYDEFINNILETRGRFACGDEYHERHHVIPKCMGGTNDEDNLIDLYAREHFEAHRLLALENPENDNLIYAWWAMSHWKADNQRRYVLTAKEYEEVRIAYINKLSELSKGENNVFFGKHHTDEQRKYWSDIRKGSKRSKDSIEKQKETCKIAFLGNNNNFYGKHHSNETRKKWSDERAGSKNPSAKPICQFNLNSRLIQCYEYIKQASKKLNIDRQRISHCCQGSQKTAGGFIWHYLYDQTRKDGTIIPGAISLGFITEEQALAQLTQQNDSQK